MVVLALVLLITLFAHIGLFLARHEDAEFARRERSEAREYAARARAHMEAMAAIAQGRRPLSIAAQERMVEQALKEEERPQPKA